jgi:hypothetical protein
VKENEVSFGIFETILSIRMESSKIIIKKIIMNLGFNYNNYAL